MPSRFLKIALAMLFAASLPASPAAPADLEALIKEFHAIPAVTANEEWLAGHIAARLPKSYLLEKDNVGGLYAWPENKKPNGAFAVLAPLDDFGYVVSGYTADGYLRIDRASAPPSPVYDSFLIGHPVVIRNARKASSGIVAQPSMHVLTRELRDLIAGAFSLDLVYVDVGARSEAEARKMGFSVLDPVSLYPDYVVLAGTKRAGPNLGRKALAAALSEVAVSVEFGAKNTRAVLVWPAQTRLTARGTRGSLGATRAANVLSLPYIIVLDAVAEGGEEKGPVLGKGPVLVVQKDEPGPLRRAVESAARKENVPLQVQIASRNPLLSPFPTDNGKEAVGLAIPVKFAGTPSEVVDLADLQALVKILSRLIVESWDVEGGVK
jgi:putative aminopeptidase FrvX